MLTESNKPLDPLVKEFCILTKMLSSDDIHVTSMSNFRAKGMRGRPRKPYKGIKIELFIQSSSSAGAGSMLKRICSSKVVGKARDRVESSPVDNRGGKRIVSTPINDEINQALSSMKYDSINSHLKFAIGSSSDHKPIVCSLNKTIDTNDFYNGYYGSFTKVSLDKIHIINNQSGLVVKSSGLKTSFEHTGMGDVGSDSCDLASSKDDIITKTSIDCDLGMTGPRTSNEHTSMEDVVSIGVVHSSSLDGIANNKVGSGFESGRNDNTKGILKKPIIPLFAKKLKQGIEEMALKMKYVPNSVCKLKNGNRRISFSTKVVYKGGEACSLQLYGYFVDISIDYRVVETNLIRTWRVYDIEDITKTSAGVYYLKFKSEEGMKTILDCVPWMVQNDPLVLNVWEPDI
ncbi:RNA-directed DNA polymerase, eukaryota, reverse transcriptase zinc-binding domain protein [Tanacetum coccineum]